MPSYDEGKREVCDWIKQNFPPHSTILDVGACDGKWRSLLPGYPMDAIEIYEPYARKLTGYRRVFNDDIRRFIYSHYDLILFGDIIEHLTVADAQAVLKYAKTRCDDVIVAVPFLYKQEEVDGNRWQRHIQDDLTPELFAERYPGFRPLHELENYCYYHLTKE